MAAAADAAERYRADFQAAGAEIPAWLAGLRKRAMERFAETGFPTARRGNEAWKYTNVSPIANAELGLAPATDITLSKALRGAPSLRAAPDGPWTTLVFVNGRFAGGSGNKVAMPLAAALDQDDSWVEAHLASDRLDRLRRIRRAQRRLPHRRRRGAGPRRRASRGGPSCLHRDGRVEYLAPPRPHCR